MRVPSLLRAAVAGLALAATVAIAQPVTAAPGDGAPMRAMRVPAGQRLVLDGTLAHPAWQQAPVHAQFTEKLPDTGAAPRHATRVRVLFDDQALWVGIEALDDAPQQIRAPLVRHDGVNRTQDFVVVYIDAIGLRQSAQFFRVNAAGSLADGMQTAADDSEDFAPDFDFDAATSRQATGWTAVLRIPFASLRFAEPDADGRLPWRIMVGRRVPREQFYLHTSVLIPREAPSFIATMQPLDGVQLPAQHHFLTLRPSLTWRTRRSRDGDAAAQRDSSTDASLDLKWRPMAELVVDAALNPDFSQVAVDAPQLTGNTGFALSLPEKRPFFFESSDLLRSPVEALYTRSIYQPRWGLRSTWRGSRLAATALAVDDRGGGLVLLPQAFGTGVAAQPASSTLLLRGHLQDGGLQWGGLAALRRYDGAGRNLVAGPDLAWQIDGHWRARLQWLQSETTATGLGPAGADGLQPLAEGPRSRGHLAHARLFYQGDDRREADLTLEDIGEGFRADTGFIAQAGVRRAKGRLGLGWGGVGPFNEFWFNLEGERVTRRDGGALVQQTLSPGLWVTGAHNLEASVYLRGLASGTAALRPAPDRPLQQQRYLQATLVMTPALWAPLLDADLRLGRLANVGGGRPLPGGQLALTLSTRLLPRLELEPHLGLAWLRDQGRTVYAEAAHQVLARWHFNASQSLRAIVGYSAIDRDGNRLDQGTTGSLTWAWRQSAGTVLYLGASRERSGLARGTARRNEGFVKLQVDADDLRRAWH